MTDPGAAIWPVGIERRFRRVEVTAPIGTGEDVWARAAHDVLHWAVKTRSGFIVDDTRKVSPGAMLVVTARFAGVTVREPVQVVEVIETPGRVGFSYQTRPGHPVAGEEAFIVHRIDERVFLTVRSLTAPAAEQPWRALFPLLRVVQRVIRHRYLRALA